MIIPWVRLQGRTPLYLFAMKNLPRILAIAAGILLVSLFFFPMWSITLVAPQYPDGVTMYIWINQISGETAGTLQNINILNHYVGMKYIEPDAIPELQYFQYIIAALIALAFITAFVDKPGVYLAWFVLFAVLAILGIYDFYLWEYDYGHNLDPKAPIKIPGASFQPPLIGYKQIINFEAYSYPHTSGYLAGIGAACMALAWFFKRKIKAS